MVIISPTRIKPHPLPRLPFTSIRWKVLLAFLLVVGLSFYMIASLLTDLVSNYLFEQRIRQDSLSVEKLATTLAPFFSLADTDTLHTKLLSAGGEMGGRLMLVDAEGKVQLDSYGTLLGVRLQLPQILAVLMENAGSDYGIHRASTAAPEGDADSYISSCAAPMVDDQGNVIGAVLFISSVQELMTSLEGVQSRMLSAFAAVAMAAMAAAMIFSRIITGPISRLTRTIQRMGRGDLSVRVPVRGSGEMRELASAYNTMAQKLETLDQSRNQFVSNASHELKTPMTSLKIMLQTLIAQPEMPAELRVEFMQDMDHEIDRLTGIINDLLTLTKMDSHALELHPAPMDLCQLVQATLRRLRPMAEKRKQTLTASLPDALPMTGDSAKLEQALYNLVDNAVKYSPEGEGIEIAAQREGRNAILTVTDHGPGIPAEDLPHIFDRFYRVDKARSRDTGGTGLGLSIVRQMVALHQGTVAVESVEGKGSVFRVELPLEVKP